jgi:hypothetical protein
VTTFWVTLKFHATGREQTFTYDTSLGKVLQIISTSGYADVLAQGETTT